MTNNDGKFQESRGGQAGSQGQHGKGQSNPGGFDQQSSSSMEREQEQENRSRYQQQKRSQEENGRGHSNDGA